jgi:predicted metal-dependent hydrolase
MRVRRILDRFSLHPSPPPVTTHSVQIELQFRNAALAVEVLPGPQPITLHFARNNRARRYILRVRRDGTVRVTIPRNGSKARAHDFAGRHGDWISKQLQALRAKPSQLWTHGVQILFRGEPTEIVVDGFQKQARVAEQVIALREIAGDLKPVIQAHLWRLASRELSARALELSRQHVMSFRRVVVRNQRSRWGSCSAKGTVSLNWRLIQTPPAVSDYLILHELAHLRQMNHSKKFWDLVRTVCPDFELAEQWLKHHNHLLR